VPVIQRSRALPVRLRRACSRSAGIGRSSLVSPLSACRRERERVGPEVDDAVRRRAFVRRGVARLRPDRGVVGRVAGPRLEHPHVEVETVHLRAHDLEVHPLFDRPAARRARSALGEGLQPRAIAASSACRRAKVAAVKSGARRAARVSRTPASRRTAPRAPRSRSGRPSPASCRARPMRRCRPAGPRSLSGACPDALYRNPSASRTTPTLLPGAAAGLARGVAASGAARSPLGRASPTRRTRRVPRRSGFRALPLGRRRKRT